MDVEVAEQRLREGKLSNIYALYGAETYMLDNFVKKIKKSFGELVPRN